MSYKKDTYLHTHNISYSILNTKIDFSRLNFSLSAQKYGLVGNNGCGKSTLLKLLAKQILPDSGEVFYDFKLEYIPQNIDENLTLAEVFGVSNILDSLAKISEGSLVNEDFDLAENNWNLKAELEDEIYNDSNIRIDLNKTLRSISGGQLTQVLLAKVKLSNAEIILLDEPTNNLDIDTKHDFINWLANTNKCVVIVSHDRRLLNQMDSIIAIDNNKIDFYTGNYLSYKSQKSITRQSITRDIDRAEKQIKKIIKSIQSSKEKFEQKAAKGKNLRKTKSVDKITADIMKSRSDKTSSKNLTQATSLQNKARKLLMESKSKLYIHDEIFIDLPNTYVRPNQSILNIINLEFAYDGAKTNIIIDFNLLITGAERIALIGRNGSGKSTLLKLINGHLGATKGQIRLSVEHGYIDQSIAVLNHEVSLLENLIDVNPNLSITEAYTILARYNFRNITAHTKVADLSGGEKVRAALAIMLNTQTVPQLLILDEPTNHLDVESIELLEQALNCYKGAILVVSHDFHFLKNINIDRDVCV